MAVPVTVPALAQQAGAALRQNIPEFTPLQPGDFAKKTMAAREDAQMMNPQYRQAMAEINALTVASDAMQKTQNASIGNTMMKKWYDSQGTPEDQRSMLSYGTSKEGKAAYTWKNQTIEVGGDSPQQVSQGAGMLTDWAIKNPELAKDPNSVAKKAQEIQGTLGLKTFEIKNPPKADRVANQLPRADGGYFEIEADDLGRNRFNSIINKMLDLARNQTGNPNIQAEDLPDNALSYAARLAGVGGKFVKGVEEHKLSLPNNENQIRTLTSSDWRSSEAARQEIAALPPEDRTDDNMARIASKHKASLTTSGGQTINIAPGEKAGEIAVGKFFGEEYTKIMQQRDDAASDLPRYESMEIAATTAQTGPLNFAIRELGGVLRQAGFNNDWFKRAESSSDIMDAFRSDDIKRLTAYYKGNLNEKEFNAVIKAVNDTGSAPNANKMITWYFKRLSLISKKQGDIYEELRNSGKYDNLEQVKYAGDKILHKDPIFANKSQDLKNAQDFYMNISQDEDIYISSFKNADGKLYHVFKDSLTGKTLVTPGSGNL